MHTSAIVMLHKCRCRRCQSRGRWRSAWVSESVAMSATVSAAMRVTVGGNR